MGWLRMLWDYFLEGVRERAGEVASLSPFRQLTGYLANALTAQSACLFPKDGMNFDHFRYPNAPGADVVGWYSEDKDGLFAYLSESRTYNWYKRMLRQHGDDPQFGWQAFIQEARADFGGVTGNRRFASDKGGHTQLRVISLPLQTLLDQRDEYEGELPT